MEEIEEARLEALRTVQPACHIHPYRIATLAEFVEVCTAITGQHRRYWFRGQGSASWSLTPSALRYGTETERTLALRSIDSFKRLVATKLRDPPQAQDELLWIQIGRHYGLPTRLLDWSESAAIGLFFACERVMRNSKAPQDGLVFILDPVELNIAVDKERPRVLDANRDGDLIGPYLELTGRITSTGRPSIAINPVWNSERLLLQKGTFTLHGASEFALTAKQAPSLLALPVLHEDKQTLLDELQIVGIDEMSIFPELEHVCEHIRRSLGL